MTMPKLVRDSMLRVRDMVREMIPTARYHISKEEARLAIHLRGNAELYESLIGIIQARLVTRTLIPVPTDPLMCKSILDRDNELRWVLARLEYVYHSPINAPDDSREPPA